ncbi:hypothetical protein GEMRC1_004582 [Eukaryota sp. GEM-RC1]
MFDDTLTGLSAPESPSSSSELSSDSSSCSDTSDSDAPFDPSSQPIDRSPRSKPSSRLPSTPRAIKSHSSSILYSQLEPPPADLVQKVKKAHTKLSKYIKDTDQRHVRLMIDVLRGHTIPKFLSLLELPPSELLKYTPLKDFGYDISKALYFKIIHDRELLLFKVNAVEKSLKILMEFGLFSSNKRKLYKFLKGNSEAVKVLNQYGINVFDVAVLNSEEKTTDISRLLDQIFAKFLTEGISMDCDSTSVYLHRTRICEKFKKLLDSTISAIDLINSSPLKSIITNPKDYFYLLKKSSKVRSTLEILNISPAKIFCLEEVTEPLSSQLIYTALVDLSIIKPGSYLGDLDFKNNLIAGRLTNLTTVSQSTPRSKRKKKSLDLNQADDDVMSSDDEMPLTEFYSRNQSIDTSSLLNISDCWGSLDQELSRDAFSDDDVDDDDSIMTPVIDLEDNNDLYPQEISNDENDDDSSVTTIVDDAMDDVDDDMDLREPIPADSNQIKSDDVIDLEKPPLKKKVKEVIVDEEEKEIIVDEEEQEVEKQEPKVLKKSSKTKPKSKKSTKSKLPVLSKVAKELEFLGPPVIVEGKRSRKPSQKALESAAVMPTISAAVKAGKVQNKKDNKKDAKKTNEKMTDEVVEDEVVDLIEEPLPPTPAEKKKNQKQAAVTGKAKNPKNSKTKKGGKKKDEKQVVVHSTRQLRSTPIVDPQPKKREVA